MTITEILCNVDYPEDTLTLDFESFFSKDYNLKDLSLIEYITDPRFEFTGLGIKINNGTSTFIPGPKVPWAIKRLQTKYGKAFQNVTVIAKNTKFDILILAQKFGIYPPYVIDIEDLSRYYDSRMKQNLASLAKMFKLQAKGDTLQFKGQHSIQAEPWEIQHTIINWVAMKEYCLGDVDIEYQLLEILLPMIDNPEIELSLMQHTLNLYLKPTFQLDAELAEYIELSMGTELDKDLAKVQWVHDHEIKTGLEGLILGPGEIRKYNLKDKSTEKILRARSIFPKILADILPEGEIVPVKQGKGKVPKTIPALASEDVGFQLLLAHSDERVRNLCKAKAACSSWPIHQKKVQNLIIQTRCFGDGVHIPLKYYGAHTGRHSGTQKWNPLNLGGKGRSNKGKLIHPLISKVRNTLLAPEGYMLPIADSCQIEARLLAWIAGQNDLVEDFRTGGDPYSVFATKLFQEKVWKPSPEEEKTPEGALAKTRRGFGKDTVLGAGFGLGSLTSYNLCRQNELLRPLFDSGEYDWDFIDKMIKLYRTTYAQIPKFWKAVEKCFRWVTKYPHERLGYCIPDINCGIKGETTLNFWKEGSTTIIQLPSGRRLFYRYASVDREGKIKYIHGYLWGGSITENIIQAICRDLLAGWLLECERRQIPIILHSYDELVGCVPENRAEESLQQMLEIMNTGPDWAAGLPLDTEGEISPCFKK